MCRDELGDYSTTTKERTDGIVYSALWAGWLTNYSQGEPFPPIAPPGLGPSKNVFKKLSNSTHQTLTIKKNKEQ